LNAQLAISAYPDLKEWLGNYQEVGRTKFSVIYRRQKTMVTVTLFTANPNHVCYKFRGRRMR
jgi:hypothetical protein